MTTNPTQTLSSDMIMAEIGALVDWHAQVVRHFFYPESRKHPVEAQPPSSLLLWCQQQAEKGGADLQNVQHLSLLYEGLYKSARGCLTAATPAQELYDYLVHHLDAYITHLRHLQKGLIAASATIDPVTGMRLAVEMQGDLKREQDRFDRKGTPFSIAHIQIDSLQELQKKFANRELDAFYAHVAQSVAKTVRSFDDTYCVGKGEYIVVLKQVAFSDACLVMERLRQRIEASPVVLDNGEKVKLTVSLGLTESTRHVSSEKLLEHAKKALQDAQKLGGNCIYEYKEMSAFEAFMKGNKDKS